MVKVLCVGVVSRIDISAIDFWPLSGFLPRTAESGIVLNRFYCDVTKMDVTLSSIARQRVRVLMKPLAQSKRVERIVKLPLF